MHGEGWALLGAGVIVLILLSAFNIYSILKLRPRIALQYKQASDKNRATE
ncbi:MAG TPA: hypothetical protein V6D14_14440 [Coleofasciculaceae cyanobacterium]